MSRPKSLKPAYCLHKPSGRAFVKLDGRRVYLGPHNSRASRDAYDRTIGEWIARDRQPLPPPPGDAQGGILVKELIARFWTHASAYYVNPDGSPASEAEVYRIALRPLNRLYGSTPAAAFGPLAMKALMMELAALGWKRKSLNRQAARVKHVFKWGVANELIPAAVHQALSTVPGYRKGKSPAAESAAVRPVAKEQVDVVLPLVSRQVRGMIELQWLTGMRPGEVCIMRTGDVDRTGPVWTYKPSRHKGTHLDDDRSIDLGPKCQEILSPFLKLDPAAYLFSPADAEADRLTALHERRKTPDAQGNSPGTNRRRKPRRPPGDFYPVRAYRNAICRACDRAYPPPLHLARLRGESPMAWRKRLTVEQRAELKAWQAAHRWHPHQLRHSAATRLRRDFGIDVARIVLGHKSDSTTSIYAERDRAKARDVMSRVG